MFVHDSYEIRIRFDDDDDGGDTGSSEVYRRLCRFSSADECAGGGVCSVGVVFEACVALFVVVVGVGGGGGVVVVVVVGKVVVGE